MQLDMIISNRSPARRAADSAADLLRVAHPRPRQPDRGLLQPALALLRRMLSSGVRPDEVIFNSVLLGCSCRGRHPMAACDVLAVFERLASRGLEPSTTTVSILPRTRDQVHAWDEAEPFLAGAPAIALWPPIESAASRTACGGLHAGQQLRLRSRCLRRPRCRSRRRQRPAAFTSSCVTCSDCRRGPISRSSIRT